ncbi:MAG TPA: hypothetical protein PKN15_05935 [Chitinophagales bacterium]|nr:hypothetical protein [Chitinophagales bacterium]HNO28310.1 hypothetical protein [Chitinophagales bacterium]
MKKVNLGIAQNKFDQIQQRSENVLHLSIAKLVGHIENPTTYPMTGDNKSIERALFNHYNILAKSEQKDFINRIKKFSNIPSNTTQFQSRFGDLAKVDLKSHTSVAEQIKSIAVPDSLKFTASEIDELEKKLLKKRVGAKSTPVTKQPAVVAPRLIRLTVESIHCTNTVELKKDEILMNALFTDALGVSTTIDLVDVGKMKDGETINLGAKGIIAEVNLNNAGFFPQTLIGTFTLIDKDVFADQEKIVSAFRTCAIIATTLTSIALISMGVAIAVAATPGGMAAAAGIMTGALIAMVGSLVILVVGGGITLALQGETSDLIKDEFVFDLNPVTLQPGEFVNRVLNVEIPRSIGKKSGNYTMTIKWERIS